MSYAAGVKRCFPAEGQQYQIPEYIYYFTTLALHDGSVYKGTRNGGKKAKKAKTVIRLHEMG
jgi:hypothetical protein